MEISNIYNLCIAGLQKFMGSIGQEKIVIGLSGGIDSAVCAALCVNAIGSENVFGVMLPGPYSSVGSIADSEKLARNLGISTEEISICSAFESLQKELEGKFPLQGHCPDEKSSENTQARLRMTILMSLSNMHGWMLVNTGNKTEAMVGYSTLYGDTAGAYAPLGGLYKRDVFALGRYINSLDLSKDAIPENIFTKPPSAELSPGQEDEKSLGISYEDLDEILISHFEKNINTKDIVTSVTHETVLNICKLSKSYAFKRDMEPPFTPISYQI